MAVEWEGEGEEGEGRLRVELRTPLICRDAIAVGCGQRGVPVERRVRLSEDNSVAAAPSMVTDDCCGCADHLA